MITNELDYCGVHFKLYPITMEDTGIANVHQKYSNSAGHSLNNYGLGPFCEFDAPPDICDKRGIYIFVVDDDVKYIGRCLDTFGKRISKGYGHISPRNCYKGGQPTNCHINRELNNAFEKGESIFIGIHSMDDISAIRELEKKLLKEQERINPDNWNIQH